MMRMCRGRVERQACSPCLQVKDVAGISPSLVGIRTKEKVSKLLQYVADPAIGDTRKRLYIKKMRLMNSSGMALLQILASPDQHNYYRSNRLAVGKILCSIYLLAHIQMYVRFANFELRPNDHVY